MSIQLGDIAPNFVAQSTIGEIDLYEYIENSWCVLFSHPADFTTVCTTEIAQTGHMIDEFTKRNVKVICLSADRIEDHEKWVNDIATCLNAPINFPIISDLNSEIAGQYGMIHPKSNALLTVRSLFIIDPDKVVNLILSYPPCVGRNYNEVLRVLDSLQLSSQINIATPANWQVGQDVVVLPQTNQYNVANTTQLREVTPYLKFSKMP